jgi:hypothetical protein
VAVELVGDRRLRQHREVVSWCCGFAGGYPALVLSAQNRGIKNPSQSGEINEHCVVMSSWRLKAFDKVGNSFDREISFLTRANCW